MANAYFYSNLAVATQLTASINASTTICQVDSTSGWPTSYPFIIALDFGGVSEELVAVTNNSSGTLTVTRGFGGTVGTSHSAGAVVRHVHNAQDDTDFRTHQAAATGVHGVGGSVVGTTDVQTLTNKTLTAPSITNPAISGGGSLSGTFTGGPTFSGGVSLTGGPELSGGVTIDGSVDGTADFTSDVTFSGDPHFTGTPQFSGDVTNVVTNATDEASAYELTGDTNPRLSVRGDGQFTWGPGNTSGDTNLYRSAANTLKTDDALVVTGALTGGSSASFTGNVSAAAATFTGNLSVGGIGQMLFAIKTTDTSRANTTTASPDPDLQLSLSANATYMIDGMIIWGHSNAGIGMDWDGPQPSDGWWMTINPSTALTTPTSPVRVVAARAEEARSYGWIDNGSATPWGAPIFGVIQTTTAITYRFLWAQASSDSTATTVYAQSYLRAIRMK